jgi:hypothetical protein
MNATTSAAIVLFCSASTAASDPVEACVIVHPTSGERAEFRPTVGEGEDWAPAWERLIGWSRKRKGESRVTLPKGTLKFSRGMRILDKMRIAGPGSERCEIVNLDAKHKNAVVFAGINGWENPPFEAADDWSLTGVTIRQTACTSAGSHGLAAPSTHRATLEDVTVVGAKHEGIVVGGTLLRATRCKAVDCGEGSEFRSFTGAGLNLNAHGMRVVECETLRCGQGFESGASDIEFVRCQALEGLRSTRFGDGNLYGFNLGNANQGCCRVRLLDCASSGHPTAVGYANVNGRSGGLTIERFVSQGGTIGVGLGRRKNLAEPPKEFSFPAGEPCVIRNCRFEFDGPATQHAVVFNGGPAKVDWKVWTDADLTVSDCKAVYRNAAAAQSVRAPFGVFGDAKAKLIFRNLEVRGLDFAPQQGHFAQSSIVANQAPKKLPNVRVTGVKAFRGDGKAMKFASKRESQS